MNTVRIDYFAVTVKNIPPERVLTDLLLIPLEDFTLNNWGVNKYQRHYACSEIKVYFNEDRLSMGVFIELKGQGCRQYEEFLDGNENNWIALVSRLYQCNANFTRIDIAHDIYDGSLDVQRIYDYCKKGLCISKAKHFEYHEKSILENGERVGETVAIGSRGNQQWCIYNKRMEKLSKQEPVEYSSWVRAELRCWQEKANIIAEQLFIKRPLSSIYFEAINGHYRFVRPNATDTNRWRRKKVKWWLDYLKTENQTVLSVERTKPTLRQSEVWTEKQVAKTLAKVYIAKYQAYDVQKAEDYIQSLLKEGLSRLTDNDEKDIEQYIREQNSSPLWGQKRTT
ncbi:TPA: replication initiation factor domain-containing protein [Streptococcus equi subsp. zooepidemicus]|uniref:replication initiation factor domain-containing protein n=1 Tax=Streptococcus equi TaxID=1336 RepID=UPI0005B6BF9B|nr:replication initiation factor domain-containing protein [Streptococcus equi]KIQ76547.1 Cro/Cl family transcriptional regulator [Streptococcus equi subsp. zooepidemicus]MCD3423965.1 replication initiation factor domain-containing protein [Streptococcus equi subsp. zooepidemicus]HEL0001780.1 replication initiation factor domain-containing protein [Streptococcus equi subsp. zooepidemicus]HEL0025374.1 replication initiation factor domain-containing protein [Streptococcus equi subsp. zooepidemicu